MKIYKQIENEISTFLTEPVPISEGYSFSQYKLITRLCLYANGVYATGKKDKQGKYKYWIDIIQSRIDSEVKNIDFDTKDISLYSESLKDSGIMILLNLYLKEWLRDNEQGVEFNDFIEEGSGWGNVVFKKVKDGYEKVVLKDFYVINQQAKYLTDTPVIERHILTQSDLRAKNGVWKNVDEVIKNCGNKGFTPVAGGYDEAKETKYYEVYERNGEVSVSTLKEIKGKKVLDGDDDKYVLAKIICAGLSKSDGEGKYVLFAEEIDEMPYKEYHRGRYNGRWWRAGIIELLLDIQTRANEISNQIARGLEWASKMVARSTDVRTAQNILTDLNNGDVIRSADLQQVNFRMEGLDQLIADWNRLMQVADKLCNSYEVVSGESMPSGTPFRMGAMLNQNANKLFDFLREKLALTVQDVFQDWILPDLTKSLKKKDILRLTGDADMMNKYYELVVNGWYIKNLLSFPPHTPADAEIIKASKMAEIRSKTDQFIKLEKGWLDGVKPRVSVVISGENVSITKDLENYANFINLEVDPIRRTALIERAMKRAGMDIEDLPKTPPMPPQMPQQATQAPQTQQNTNQAVI